MKSANKKPRPREDAAQRYLGKTIESIEGKCDREAVRLLFGNGALCIDDPGTFDEAVARIAGTDGSRAVDRFYEKHYPGDGKRFVGDPIKALNNLDGLLNDRERANVEAAYLLGVAVGRRIGPAPLARQGGVR